MISMEGHVVVIYIGLLHPKIFWDRVISSRRSSNIVLVQSKSVSLSRCLHAICAHILPHYMRSSPLIPSPSGGLTSWIAAQLQLGGIIILSWLLTTSRNGLRLCLQLNPTVRLPRILFSTRLSPGLAF